MTSPRSTARCIHAASFRLFGALLVAGCVGEVGSLPDAGVGTGSGSGTGGTIPTTPVLSRTSGDPGSGPASTGRGGAGAAGPQGGGMAGTGGTSAGSMGSGSTFGGGSAGFGGSGSGPAGTGGPGSTGLAGTAGTGTAGSFGRGGSSGRTGSPDAGARDAAGSDGPPPADAGSAPTFTAVYTDVFVAYCSGSQCHNPGSQHGVSFSSKSTAYSAVSSRVVKGNAQSSSIYTIISQGRMPPGGGVPADKLAELAAWINAGAANN